jgi:hypothetical protein
MINEDVPKMLDDKREVSAVIWANGNAWFRVGKHGTTAIKLYPETGPMGWVPWIAIYKGDVISDRIDAAGKEIEYAEGYQAQPGSSIVDPSRLR